MHSTPIYLNPTRRGETPLAILRNALAGLAESFAVLRGHMLLGQHKVDVVGENALLESDDVNEACDLL
eukprot:2438236-Lingulodinium_polyedra.AAC.1